MEHVPPGPPQWRSYVVSLSAPTGPIERFDTSIEGTQKIVINDKLKRGYALVASGVIEVFSTESDTLVSTSRKPSCYLHALAINQATDVVYGGGATEQGACLVEFDADAHIVRENVVGPGHAEGQEPADWTDRGGLGEW